MAGIRRFYADVAVAADEGGYSVTLDGRPVLSPNRRKLVLPTAAFAEALAAEWRRQGEVIVPSDMPLMRLAGQAIDAAIPAPAPLRAEIVKYARSDLLCYRAPHPAELVARQARGWDPVLERFQQELGIALRVVAGIGHVEQGAADIAKFELLIEGLSSFALIATHEVTTLTGSALLAVALYRDWLAADTVWQLSHLDEDYQAERWGEDDEAVQRRRLRYADYSAAALALRYSSSC